MYRSTGKSQVYPYPPEHLDPSVVNGTAPVDMGTGGSIPFIAEFQEMFHSASILVTGVEDSDTRAYGPNG